MDFIFIILIYTMLFAISVVLYFFGDAPLLRRWPIGPLRKFIFKVITKSVPSGVQDLLSKFIHYLFFTRNQFLRVMFGILITLGHLVCIIDMLPILYRFVPEENHVFLPLWNIFVNLYFYHKCCNNDPGEINQRNLDRYKSIYRYNPLYTPGAICRTCKFVKPARSKHCSICNRCVHRFDHHCIWTNNDVGGLNHGHFVSFLLSFMFMLFNGVYCGSRCLLLHTRHTRLFQASVVLATGETIPVTWLIVFQHLFMTFPRIVFIIVSLGLLIPLCGLFTGYHVYLVILNQTTNERYKMEEVKMMKGKTEDIDSHNKESKIAQKKRTKNSNKKDGTGSAVSRFYNKGFFTNIQEVFFPRSFIQKRLKR